MYFIYGPQRMKPTDISSSATSRLIFVVQCAISATTGWISPQACWSHLVVILLLVVIQEANGTDPVLGFVVPCVICHVIHQALQGSAAGKTIRDWGLFV